MNHDLAASIEPSRVSRGNISGSGIGDVQRLVEGTVGISIIQPVLAFRCSAIPLLFFAVQGMPPQRDRIRLNQLVAAIQLKTSLSLSNDNQVRHGIRR